jgi:hypothetical protein
VTLNLLDDGWYIQSSGQGEVFVNQSPVVGLTRIRSGAIVRMSEFGPEFEFRILARSAATAGRDAARLSPVSGPQPSPVGSAASAPPFPAVPAAPIVPGAPANVSVAGPVPTVPSAPAFPADQVSFQEPLKVSPASRGGDGGRLAVIVGGGILGCLMLLVLVKLMMTPSVVVVQPVEPQKPPEKKDLVQPVEPQEPPEPQKSPEPQKADPVLARLEGALLLIEMEKAGQFWPFATCCALTDNTVLVSAREALQVGRWLNDPASGFKGWVANPATGAKFAIREARIYAVSVGAGFAEKPTDWLYTNLGLVTVQGPLPKTAELAGPEELAQLAQGKPVRAYGYVHEGDLITPEDHLELRQTPGKILFTSAHPDLPGKPRLLGVKAELPKFPHGSPLVNAQGKIVAIYGDPVADAAADPKAASPGTENVHYATVVNPGVIDLWLKRSDGSIWVSTAELKTPGADRAPAADSAKVPGHDSKVPGADLKKTPGDSRMPAAQYKTPAKTKPR